MALPQMRSVALMIPALVEGGLLTFGSSVRPRATAHWPIFTSFFGTAFGTVRPEASTLINVIMRVWSVAIVLATLRSFWPGMVTKTAVGLLAKLKALVMT